MGGFKGVLAVYRDLEQPDVVQLRPSMEKFACEDGKLGVMKVRVPFSRT